MSHSSSVSWAEKTTATTVAKTHATAVHERCVMNESS